MGKSIIKVFKKQNNLIFVDWKLVRDECFCGDSYGSYGTATSRNRRCDFKCSKDKREMCGGDHANAVYCSGKCIIILF